MLQLRTRIGFIFAAVLFSLLLVTGVAVWANQVAQRDQRQVEEIYMPQLEAAREMGAIAADLLAGHLLTIKDPRDLERHAGDLQAQRRSFERAWARSAQLAHTDAERAELSRIDHAFKGMVLAQARLLARLHSGQRAEAAARHAEEASPAVVALRRGTNALYHLKRAQVAQLRAAALARGDQAVGFSLLATLVALGVATWLWRRATRDLAEPLVALRHAAAEVAHGRYTKVSHPRAMRTTELAALEADFNTMADRLEDSRTRLHEANATLERVVAERTLQLRTANASLAAANEELRTLDRMKSDFMAVMSHELLTPINFIMGFGSALEDGLLGSLNPAQRRTLGKLMDGTDRLTRMVRNTLEYTQLAAGRLAVLPEAVDVAAAIRDVAHELRPVLAQRDQILELELQPALPLAFADPDRTRQVLVELLDNASKFSPRGARLTLAAEAAPGAVTISVVDPGSGITEAALPHLFEPFYQADGSRTRAQGGMGLGLPIAFHLVALMGGSLLVSSQAGPHAGTPVRVTLPRALDGPGDEGNQGYTKTSSHA